VLQRQIWPSLAVRPSSHSLIRGTITLRRAVDVTPVVVRFGSAVLDHPPGTRSTRSRVREEDAVLRVRRGCSE
jgi:hypothetical protein